MKSRLLNLISGLLILVSLAACSALPAAAGAQPAQPAATRQLNASGTGQVYLTPDIAYINIGVHSQADSVSLALSDNNAQAQAVASSLTELGVDKADIQTSAFNVYPQPQYNQMGEQTGMMYSVDNTVYVTVRDLQKLSQVLDAVVSAGANNINGIQFDVKNNEEALTKARQMAIENARKNAEEMAKAAGVELGNLMTINVYNTGAPTPVFEGKGFGGAMAAPSVPVSSGQLVLTVNADLSFEIK